MVLRAISVGVVVLAGISASVVLLAERSRRAIPSGPAEQKAGRPGVEIVRLIPPGDAIADVDCASLAFVEFTYQIRNKSSAPIKGLKLGTKCSCEVVGDPPDEILPGKSAPISFRLRGPYVGMLRRQIPLVSDGADDPLSVLSVALHVKFEPPDLVPPPDGLSATFVKGNPAAHDLVLEAIEARGSARWLRRLKLDPSESIEVESFRVEDLPEADPDLLRRRYHFTLVNRSLPIGQHTVTATVHTSDGSAAVKKSLTIWVNVVDSVAIVPNPLVIKYPPGSTPPSRRVLVVDRTGNQPLATTMKFDHDLLRVEAAGRQGGSTAAFDVAAVETPGSVVETQVVFNVGDDDTRSLVVRFEPSEQR